VIYIDAGAFLARYIERDHYHDAAIKNWRTPRNDRRRCFTSSLVLDEMITLLARRSTYQFAAERSRNLLESKSPSR